MKILRNGGRLIETIATLINTIRRNSCRRCDYLLASVVDSCMQNQHYVVHLQQIRFGI